MRQIRAFSCTAIKAFFTASLPSSPLQGRILPEESLVHISALVISEAVRVDSRRVADIIGELGETAAQNVIGLALEQLAGALVAVQEALEREDLVQAATQSDRLSRLSWQIGLLSLAGVAMDLSSMAERGDLPAVGAIGARLARVGNQSLTAIWDRTALS